MDPKQLLAEVLRPASKPRFIGIGLWLSVTVAIVLHFIWKLFDLGPLLSPRGTVRVLGEVAGRRRGAFGFVIRDRLKIKIDQRSELILLEYRSFLRYLGTHIYPEEAVVIASLLHDAIRQSQSHEPGPRAGASEYHFFTGTLADEMWGSDIADKQEVGSSDKVTVYVLRRKPNEKLVGLALSDSGSTNQIFPMICLSHAEAQKLAALLLDATRKGKGI